MFRQSDADTDAKMASRPIPSVIASDAADADAWSELAIQKNRYFRYFSGNYNMNGVQGRVLLFASVSVYDLLK